MSIIQNSDPTAQSTIEPEWEVPQPPTDLIFDDGEPLETNRHRMAMNVLIRSVKQALRDRTDFFAGGNMFVYYSGDRAFNKDFRGPDFFVVLDIESNDDRLGWVVWQENDRYPDVIVELLSPSTAAVDRGIKKDLYEQVFRTPDYFIFNPFGPSSLRGWHLNASGRYQPLVPNPQGWLWCETLGLWLGTWEGAIEGVLAVWLRFYDVQGQLVPLLEEWALQQAEQAQQQAEQAQQQAEQAQQQAEQAQQQAEAERQRAEAERQRAEAERQRAERLAARLREMGINPEEIS